MTEVEEPREVANAARDWSTGTESGVPTLGAWVRSTRLAQGINQRELAERAGVSRSYVSDIELGRGVHPSLETLNKLASSLGAARIDILRAAGYLSANRGGQTDNAELRLIRLYRDLSTGTRATVDRFVHFVHTEESRWSQASFMDEDADHTEPLGRSSRLEQGGPTLFDVPGDPEAGDGVPGRLP